MSRFPFSAPDSRNGRQPFYSQATQMGQYPRRKISMILTSTIQINMINADLLNFVQQACEASGVRRILA